VTRWRWLLLSALLLVGVIAASNHPHRQRQLVLWAWERPEDLRFANPRATQVAYLAGTYTLQNGAVLWHPRRQPLLLATGTQPTVVMRIEADPQTTSNMTSEQIAGVTHQITDTLARTNSRELQIDFDAFRSQRDFYRALIVQLDSALAPLQPKPVLSITALASWCGENSWLHSLPIDHAVPMLFRMGVEQRIAQRYLSAGASPEEPLCRHTVGVSLEEPRPPLRDFDKVYAFSDTPWTPDKLALLQREAKP